MPANPYEDDNVRIYQKYTKWLESLPEATEIGKYHTPDGAWSESIYIIEGRPACQWLMGVTGHEQPDSVIASLPQGNLLKARVFNLYHPETEIK